MAYRTTMPAQLNLLLGRDWLIISAGVFPHADTQLQERVARQILQHAQAVTARGSKRKDNHCCAATQHESNSSKPAICAGDSLVRKTFRSGTNRPPAAPGPAAGSVQTHLRQAQTNRRAGSRPLPKQCNSAAVRYSVASG